MKTQGWISVRVVDGREYPYLVSIPKSVVRLATRRNRLRRLIREAIRTRIVLPDHERCYVLRVEREPGDVGLTEAHEELKLRLERVK